MSEKCFQNRKKLLPDGNPLRNFIRETGGYVYQFRIDRFFENKRRLLPQKKSAAEVSSLRKLSGPAGILSNKITRHPKYGNYLQIYSASEDMQTTPFCQPVHYMMLTEKSQSKEIVRVYERSPQGINKNRQMRRKIVYGICRENMYNNIGTEKALYGKVIWKGGII